MPYHIGEQGSHNCDGYPVVQSDSGEAVGCHETLADAKRHLAALYANVPDVNKAESFKPPQAVRSAAARGLELRKKFGRGGTAVGIARARDLSNGTAVSYDTIKRMNSFFARHEVDKKGKDWDNAERPSNGKIAWLLWGGDAGWAWAKRIIREQESKEKSVSHVDAHSYAEIVKAEKQEDGTLLVYGKATDDSLDVDQQICDPAWLDRAMPEWFKSGGNIREQHSNIAAGVATEYEAKSDGHYIRALVVDPVSVKKVETRVLKGFSIGIRAPRIVRDTKAANGRIIDGMIVEVSLVDRPANPNAKLMLAKSVDGELSQTEEYIEIQDQAQLEDTMKATELIEVAKSLVSGETVKYDAAQYEAARRALASLIVTEAQELAEGHDERNSLHHLMEAVEHLLHWRDGEAYEGEAPMLAETEEMEEVELAADADVVKAESTEGCGCEGCEACKSDGGCDDKMCKGHDADKSDDAEEEDAEKSAEPEAAKCLECGCHQPSDSHGREDVTTAEMVQEKSADADAVASPQISDDEIASIVEKAVQSATESVRNEFESLKAAKQAAEKDTELLRGELAAALSKAANGGPKRSVTTMDSNTINAMLQKSAEYAAKAANTSDPVLAKGYKALADDFAAKAAINS